MRTKSKDDTTRVGRTIESLRVEKGWSLEDLASRASMSRQGVHMIEQGIRTGRLPTLRKIAEALGVSLGEIV